MQSFYSTNNRFNQSSKNNPCPVCGRTKDSDCRISPDSKLVLCHRNVNHERTPQAVLNQWHYLGETSDGRCGQYCLKEDDRTEKPIRPAQTRYWEYPARDGSKFVRVKRIDFGDERKRKFSQERWNGKRWISNLDGIDRADIPMYRYVEVRQAISQNRPIFLVEGEPCADLLWGLGLTATCNIGGGGKWQPSDTSDLDGAQVVVIVPDRDEPGIKHANCLAQEFPDAQWLYPYPNSQIWQNPPASDGLDIADWIEDQKLSAEYILAAVEKRKNLAAPPMPAKILSHPNFFKNNLDNLGVEIDEILREDLKKSEIQGRIADLAQKYHLPYSDIWKICHTREQELEQEANREDTALEIAQLLNSQKTQINLAEIIPSGLAIPIEKLAKLLNLRSECYLVAFLTQVSSLFKVGTQTMLRRDSDFRVTPNYFAGIVAESSQKKSPIMQAIIDRPMKNLREKARQEFEKAQSAYEEELSQWKKAIKKGEEQGSAPKPPRQKLYSFSKATGEGILYQVAEHPEQALMYHCDELAGLFKSANQYRGGKGSDEEDLLEFWGGTGSTVLRASGTKADLEGLLLSVFGTIQPDVLATFLRDCSDSNGKFARFDFVTQPLAPSKPPLDDSGSFDLTPMLTDLYTKIDNLPALKLELDREAKRYFTQLLWAIEERRVAEPMQGKRATIGKMPTKIGKLATVIHVLNCVFNNQQVTSSIPKQAVEAAAKFVAFTFSQVEALYTEFSDRKALAPNLVKIISLAERKGGIVSTRDVSTHFTSKYRPTRHQIWEWFSELVSMKYGEVTREGQKILFTLYPYPQLPTLNSNSVITSDWITHTSDSDYPHLPTDNSSSVGKCGQSVGSVTHTSKTLLDKELKPSVGSVGKISPPSQNSDVLMMSCTTETPPPEPRSSEPEVSPEDAEKMREIARVWWSEFYPQDLTSLMHQMFSWGEPGDKYSLETIVRWLETEDKDVCDRISELMRHYYLI